MFERCPDMVANDTVRYLTIFYLKNMTGMKPIEEVLLANATKIKLDISPIYIPQSGSNTFGGCIAMSPSDEPLGVSADVTADNLNKILAKAMGQTVVTSGELRYVQRSLPVYLVSDRVRLLPSACTCVFASGKMPLHTQSFSYSVRLNIAAVCDC